jgi:prophage antirepressor-like protein
MNEIKIFNNEEFGSVRVMEIDKEPWFIGKDITTILGYTNPTKAMQDHVDKEDMSFNETLKLSRQSGAWLINESGVYSLILSSKLPSAKKFKHWVTSEVLPSVRKTGGYVNDDELFI